MASLIRDIAKYSDDAIHLALNSVFQDDVLSRQIFENKLREINQILEKPPKKRTTERHIAQSHDTHIFNEAIIPQIRQKIDEYEQHLIDNVEGFDWHLNTDFVELDLTYTY